MNTAEKIAALSAAIDANPSNVERDSEAQLWGRAMKVAEEVGEVTAALIGATGQNPRKGYTHTMDDVRKELLDVALSALSAVEYLDHNAGTALLALHWHVEKTFVRAGLNEVGR